MKLKDLSTATHEEQKIEVLEQYTLDTLYKGKNKFLRDGFKGREVVYIKTNKDEIMIVVRR